MQMMSHRSRINSTSLSQALLGIKVQHRVSPKISNLHRVVVILPHLQEKQYSNLLLNALVSIMTSLNVPYHTLGREELMLPSIRKHLLLVCGLSITAPSVPNPSLDHPDLVSPDKNSKSTNSFNQVKLHVGPIISNNNKYPNTSNLV